MEGRLKMILEVGGWRWAGVYRVVAVGMAQGDVMSALAVVQGEDVWAGRPAGGQWVVVVARNAMVASRCRFLQQPMSAVRLHCTLMWSWVVANDICGWLVPAQLTCS